MIGPNDDSWIIIRPNTGTTTTTFTHTGFQPVSRYQYQVAAINRPGPGPWAPSPSELPAAVLTHADLAGAPTGLTARAVGTSRIDLAWNAPRYTEGVSIFGYRVEASDDGGARITGYRIEVSADGGRSWEDPGRRGQRVAGRGLHHRRDRARRAHRAGRQRCHAHADRPVLDRARLQGLRTSPASTLTGAAGASYQLLARGAGGVRMSAGGSSCGEIVPIRGGACLRGRVSFAPFYHGLARRQGRDSRALRCPPILWRYRALRARLRGTHRRHDAWSVPIQPGQPPDPNG